MKELLHNLFFEITDKFSNKIAIIDGDRNITYSDLNTLCDKYLEILLSCNVKKGDRVGIFSNKSIEVIASILAILKVGAAFVPINNAPESKDIFYIINDCGIKVIFADDSIGQILDGDDQCFESLKTIILIGKRMEYNCDRYEIINPGGYKFYGNTNYSMPSVIGNDLAYVYYTSGSTGEPKGVMISHSSIVFVIKYRRAILNFDSKSVTLSLCALYFDPVINEIFCTLSVGGKLIFIAGNNSIMLFKSFQRIIKREPVSIFFCVPSFLNILKVSIKKLAGDLGNLKYIVFGAGMCSPKLIQNLSLQLPDVSFVHGYGLTETSVTACSYRITDPWNIDYESYPIGAPIENTEFYVIEGNNAITSGVGELVIRGPHLMKGYWGKLEETNKVLKNNPILPEQNEKVLFTGDLVRVEKNNDLIFVGRKDEQIKSSGHRIELGEVEMRIGRCQGIRQICVIAVPDEQIGYKMYGYCVLDEGTTIGDVKKYCEENLLHYMIPQCLYAVAELPQNSNGKIDKKKLRSSLI